MTETSPRFGLPFLAPGQAQKELYHNEALAIVDASLHAAVEEEPLGAPPAAPEPGQCWIVGAAATGDWAGKDGRIASWSGAGWRFVTPVPGMLTWKADAGYWLHWSGSGWSDGELPAAALVIGGQQVVGPRLAEVPSPSGGTTIDAEARGAIDSLIATLRSHGLTD